MAVCVFGDASCLKHVESVKLTNDQLRKHFPTILATCELSKTNVFPVPAKIEQSGFLFCTVLSTQLVARQTLSIDWSPDLYRECTDYNAPNSAGGLCAQRVLQRNFPELVRFKGDISLLHHSLKVAWWLCSPLQTILELMFADAILGKSIPEIDACLQKAVEPSVLQKYFPAVVKKEVSVSPATVVSKKTAVVAKEQTLEQILDHWIKSAK